MIIYMIQQAIVLDTLHKKQFICEVQMWGKKDDMHENVQGSKTCSFQQKQKTFFTNATKSPIIYIVIDEITHTFINFLSKNITVVLQFKLIIYRKYMYGTK